MKVLLLQQLIPLALAVDLAKLFANFNKADPTWQWTGVVTNAEPTGVDVQARDWGQKPANTKTEGDETNTQQNAWNHDTKPWEVKLVWWGEKKQSTGWGEEKQLPKGWGEEQPKGWGEEQPKGWGEEQPEGWGEKEQATACCDENPAKWGEQQPTEWGS